MDRAQGKPALVVGPPTTVGTVFDDPGLRARREYPKSEAFEVRIKQRVSTIAWRGPIHCPLRKFHLRQSLLGSPPGRHQFGNSSTLSDTSGARICAIST